MTNALTVNGLPLRGPDDTTPGGERLDYIFCERDRFAPDLNKSYVEMRPAVDGNGDTPQLVRVWNAECAALCQRRSKTARLLPWASTSLVDGQTDCVGLVSVQGETGAARPTHRARFRTT